MNIKYLVPGLLMGFSLLAWAIVRGPFHVAALGPEMAQTTYSTDASTEYEAAERLFTLYVFTTVVTPAERLAAVKNDYMRVVYFDGQIADFKILNFSGGTLGRIKFKKLQPTVDAPSPPSRLSGVEKIGECGRGAQYFTTRTTFDTGYWGDSQGTRPNPDGGLPIVFIIANWISTGSVTVTERESCK